MNLKYILRSVCEITTFDLKWGGFSIASTKTSDTIGTAFFLFFLLFLVSLKLGFSFSIGTLSTFFGSSLLGKNWGGESSPDGVVAGDDLELGLQFERYN